MLTLCNINSNSFHPFLFKPCILIPDILKTCTSYFVQFCLPTKQSWLFFTDSLTSRNFTITKLSALRDFVMGEQCGRHPRRLARKFAARTHYIVNLDVDKRMDFSPSRQLSFFLSFTCTRVLRNACLTITYRAALKDKLAKLIHLLTDP